MTEREARQAVAVAGRELGSGPDESVKRICPGVAEAQYEEAVKRHEAFRPEIQRKYPFDEKRARSWGKRYAYGMAVGLLMAEEPGALKELEYIYDEWRENS